MKIRSYLAVMAGAILVPVIAFSAVTLHLMLKSERDAALNGVRETARTALVSIDRELTNTHSALRMLANSQRLADGDYAGFYDEARYADQLGTTLTALFDERGQLLLTTAVPYGTPMPPANVGARVSTAFASGQWQITNRLQTTVARRIMVAVDLPVASRGGQRYMLTQGYDIGHFDKVLRQRGLPHGWRAGVFDRDAVTIARVEGDAAATGRLALPGIARPALRAAILARTVGVIDNQADSASDGGDIRFYTVLERSALSGWTVAIGVPAAQIEAVARRALALSLAGLLAACACAGAAAWLFSRRLAASIGAAAAAARAIERGEQGPPAARSGVEEVDAVGAAINAAGAVIASEKNQRQLAEEERALLHASERAARASAEQQNRAKDAFLAMLGHELRNPLAAIVNAGHVLQAGGNGDPAADVVVRQSGHLARIVDDLLDVGRVVTGKILLSRQPLRLDSLVEAHAASAAAGRGAGHLIGVDAAPVWVDADPTRIEQIVANLLDNAIKYTPPGGRIDLSVAASVDGAEAVFAVTDSGIGIGPELMPTVFDLFVQGERGLDRAQGGLGVGLALVRQLAQLHGGRVTVHSAGAGQGSRFELRLPLGRAPAVGAAAPIPQPVAPPRALSILLVEDNADSGAMMALMLEAQGHRVALAVDGMQGLALAQARPREIDLALIDIGLPGIDGFEVARRLRADSATATITLVALTGYGLDSDRTMALDAGFDSHLVKPVDKPILMALLARVSVAPPHAV